MNSTNPDRPSHEREHLAGISAREPDNLPGVASERRAMLAGLGGLAAGAFLAGAQTAHAGPLSPPAGPVAPTPGPEPRIAVNDLNTPGDENSLFRITQPGSYYLTGNLAGASGKNGILISSSNVTLDLMGFTLQGVPGSLTAVTGVGAISGISVVNGSIRNWGGTAIAFDRLNSREVRIDRVSVSGTTTGISAGNNLTVTNSSFRNNGLNVVAGSLVTVTNCTIENGTSDGMSVDGTCSISHCTITGCQGNGLTANNGSRVTNCLVTSNGGVGILLNTACIVADCVLSGNDGDGILGTAHCLIRNNVCSFNGAAGGQGAGIRVTNTNNRVEANHCNNNQIGFRVTSGGNILMRNTGSDNALRNWDVVGNNVCLVVVPSFSGPISGNSGGSATALTDPNANFSY